MPAERVVVIGGSAGALEGLLEIVKNLPGDFPAAVLVTLHLSPDYPSRLPNLLNEAGPLGAAHAQSGEEVRPGCIYVAPPDQHLLVQRGYLALSNGPKENRSRPSIDVLFRSAAYGHGRNALGVLLSGMLDDGASGLWAIKQFGGQAVVQHPEEAPYPSMPLSAAQRVEVDDVLRVREIAPRLCAWAARPRDHEEGQTMDERGRQRLELELRVAAEDSAFDAGVLNLGPLSPFTCPECHGVMVRIKEGDSLRFRCHTGHAFSAPALLSELRESVEAALWTSVRSLDENVMLLEHLEKHLTEVGQSGEPFGQEARYLRGQNQIVREVAMQSRQRRRDESVHARLPGRGTHSGAEEVD